MSDQIITKEKYQALKEELEHLKNTKRKEIAASLEYAKSLGDLSENAEYHEARQDQAIVESRIATIESILKEAQIVEKPQKGVVGVGSTVVVSKKGSSSKLTFYIVGNEEADITKGNISYESPLGKSLMGKKVGEQATVRTPSGDVVYKIISV